VIARLRRTVSDQLSRPSGRRGRIVAALMNRGNRGLNERAIELLDVRAGARVLDLGFGGGLTFDPLLERGATIVGVDRAEDMVSAATSRRRVDVDAGRIALHAADVTALPIDDGAVDRALTVNTVYFWPDLDPALAELHRVLSPGGRVVVGIRDGSVMEKVDELIHISHRMRSIALQSAIGGMAASMVGMIAAAAGYLPPLEGAILQEIIDFAAVVNAVRVAFPVEVLTDF